MIAMRDCVRGRVYGIVSRNLAVGVYDGRGGFLGIREKFGHRYIFQEYHRETGAPFGTVSPMRDLGVDVPEGVVLEEGLGTADAATGREIVMDEAIPNPHGERYAMGWWKFKDTGETCPPECSARTIPNPALYDFLLKIEEDNP